MIVEAEKAWIMAAEAMEHPIPKLTAEREDES